MYSEYVAPVRDWILKGLFYLLTIASVPCLVWLLLHKMLLKAKIQLKPGLLLCSTGLASYPIHLCLKYGNIQLYLSKIWHNKRPHLKSHMYSEELGEVKRKHLFIYSHIKTGEDSFPSLSHVCHYFIWVFKCHYFVCTCNASLDTYGGM